jgi:hypothetical protein
MHFGRLQPAARLVDWQLHGREFKIAERFQRFGGREIG